MSYDYLFKIILVGDSSVGKSCILLRFVDNVFSDSYVSTIGVDFRVKTMEVNDKRVKVQVWDTAGQERFRTITTAYYRGADAIMMVYDVTSEESFNNIRSWSREIDATIENTFKFLVGNKSDRKDRAVSEESGRKLAMGLGIPFLEVSAKTTTNVQIVFLVIVSLLIRVLEDTHRCRVTSPPNEVKVKLRSRERRRDCCDG